MKKHLSVFALYVRSIIVPLMAILIAMTTVEIVLFRRQLSQLQQTMRDMIDAELFLPASVESLIHNARLTWIFAAAFLLITLLLCKTGCEKGARPSYTLRRLRISPQSTALWQTLTNVLAYLILLGAQIVLLHSFISQYTAIIPQSTNQTAFLAWYRSDFAHSLLPLDELTRTIRNICFLCALSTAVSLFSLRQRKGRFAISTVLWTGYMLFTFIRPVGELTTDIWGYFLSAITVAYYIWVILVEESNEYEQVMEE